MKEDLPEILNPNWRPDEGRLYHLLWRPWRYVEWHELADDFRKWIRVGEIRDIPSRRTLSVESCPAVDCPLKQLGASPPQKPTTESDSEEPRVLDLVCAAGGPNRKPPKDEFFNLVRRVHHGVQNVKEVILTDPYIYADVGEDGKPGGFNYLIEYLRILGLEPPSEFTLRTN